MTGIESVCVFCGSRMGHAPGWRALAEETGRLLAEAGIAVVYGAGGIGLMGAVADAALAAGGRVTGVIPTFLEEREVAHTGIGELVETPTMHERKALMHERSDAFLVLPGGIGTLDELVEALSWVALELHDKPVVLVDRAFWSPFVELLAHLDRSGFLAPQLLAGLVVVDSAEEALARLRR